MRTIPNLELHVAHSCNLTCESCSHYSNQNHKGLLSLSDAEQWMRAWSGRLRPQLLSLLGGEPTINSDLAGFFALGRKYFPHSHLRMVTNGFFLHRHPELPEAMLAAGNSAIYLSIHHQSEEYKKKLEPAVELLKEWIGKYKIHVQTYHSVSRWTRRYHGVGSAMEPYQDGQPRQSWERCPAKTCSQLFEGKIWKCAPLAYLGMQDAKYKLSESWAPYLKYRPLSPECSDAEFNEFFAREEESVCGMCPAKPEKFALPLPLRRVAA